MSSIITEQFVFIVISITGASTYLIKEFGVMIAKYKDKSLELNFKIKEAQANIEIENLKKSAERENLKEDKLLQIQLNRNALYDGIKLINILKDIRETIDAKSVYISIFHNNIAKGFKNYSIRFEESRSVDYCIADKFQSMPISPFYPDLIKFEKEDFIIATVDTSVVEQIKLQLKQQQVNKKIYFPLLDEISKSKHPNNIMTIKKDKVDYVLIGVVVISLDTHSFFNDDETTIIGIMEEKLIQIHKLYNENNLIFS
jgi:hypothetical protein